MVTTCSSAALHLLTGRSDIVVRQYVKIYSLLRFSSGCGSMDSGKLKNARDSEDSFMLTLLV